MLHTAETLLDNRVSQNTVEILLFIVVVDVVDVKGDWRLAIEANEGRIFLNIIHKVPLAHKVSF